MAIGTVKAEEVKEAGYIPGALLLLPYGRP